MEPPNPEHPWWNNPWFSGLDAVALYSYLSEYKPALYIEIGSGNSTKFARQAIRDHQLSTRLVSIDPFPRAAIDRISDEVIRQPLEAIDLSIFDRLKSGDIIILDSSHRSFMNSDVTVFFLEVMPRLPSGILIHIHDIHLPFDYPPERALQWESDQYLVAAMLIGGMLNYEVVLPVPYVLQDSAASLGTMPAFFPRTGTSLWMRKM